MPDMLVGGPPSTSTQECSCGRDRVPDPDAVSADEPICEQCDQRISCCECEHCEQCRAACESVCTRFDNCDQHCDCSFCNACNDPCEWTCGDCGRCSDCDCDCESDDSDNNESNVPRRTSRDIFHRSLRNEFAINTSRRFLACELEFDDADDGFHIDRAVAKWGGGIVDDGSLPSSGFEITTAPANGDRFVAQIRDICDALESDNATINSDCGFHVHVDARDFKYWDLRRLVILYAKIEGALFGMVPRGRRHNSYCQRCGPQYLADLTETNRIKAKMIENVYGFSANRTFRATRVDKYHPARYKALNIHSWFFRGTIECRLAAGTTNATKIINWATLWASILDYANEHVEAEISTLGTGLDALMHVAPEAVRPWIIDRTRQFRGVLEEPN